MQGKQYRGRKKTDEGELVTREPRVMSGRCCSHQCEKRKNRCCNDIDDDSRRAIFTDFWSTMDWNGRKLYVRGLVDFLPVKRKTTDGEESRRKASLAYFLKPDEGSRKQVCKSMFLATLGIGEWSVHDWVSQGLNRGKDERKNPSRHSDGRTSVRMFLEALPKVPSHYCRSSSSKLYLEPIVTSMAQLHDLYITYCEDNGIEHHMSRQVLGREFKNMNISLYQPKKDQCDTCCAYKAGNLPEEEWQLHCQRKNNARNAKQVDKEACAQQGSATLVFTMDLEALLLCPKLEAYALFYKTKLGVHNFTLFNMADHSVMCYVWHEGQGGLNANEFATCIMDYLTKHDDYDEYIVWSDGCGYQNRNTTLSNALLNFATARGKTITQKYLERGHTQMEIDSVHSVIERKLKNKEIHCPADYISVMKTARKHPAPYAVSYVDHAFFRNFGSLNLLSSIRPGIKVGDPTVNAIRCIRYNRDGTVEFKLNHDDTCWSPLPMRRSSRVHPAADCNNQEIPALYMSPLKIKAQKYKHLQELKHVIPADFHAFYDALPHD